MVSFNSKAGLFDNVTKLQNTSKKNYINLVQRAIKYNLKNQKDLTGLNLNLSKEYLSIVLFETDKKYIPLFKKNDECRFGELLTNKLIRPLDKVVFDATIENKKVKAFFTVNDAINYFKSRPDCSKIENFSLSFKKENISQTFDALEIEDINGSVQCEETFGKINKSPYLPYLCGIDLFFQESAIATLKIDQSNNMSYDEKTKLLAKIRTGQIYKDRLTPWQVGFIRNLCNNINDQENFCLNYTVKNIWLASLNGEFPKDSIKYRCQQFLGFIPEENKSYSKCVKRFSENEISECQKSLRGALLLALFSKTKTSG